MPGVSAGARTDQAASGGFVRSIPSLGSFFRQSVQSDRPFLSQSECAGFRHSSHLVLGTMGMGAPTR